MRTILFVCSGNTCRSPMAEAVARHLLDRGALGEAGRAVFVASAGTSAGDGQPVTPEAVDALRRRGIALDGRSKPLSAAMIQKADIVFTMTRAHQKAVEELAGGPDADRIQMLDPAGDVEDPIGMGQDAYDAVAGRLLELIESRLKETLGHENRAGSGSSG